MGAVCHSSVQLQKVPSDIQIGLCFMAKECDENMHLTCHRYEPVRLNSNHTPIMYAQKLHPNKRGFYKSFSSGWNGQNKHVYLKLHFTGIELVLFICVFIYKSFFY
jgi:hypothetical protein